MVAVDAISPSQHQEKTTCTLTDRVSCDTDDSNSWFLWKLVPLIAQMRHGAQWDRRNQSISLLDDPEFLYQTFYRYNKLLQLQLAQLSPSVVAVTANCSAD